MSTVYRKINCPSIGRTENREILEQFDDLQKDRTLALILDAMPQHVAVLDDNRQIVAANAGLLKTFGHAAIDQVLGVRIGELINCRHSHETPAGCGTSESCYTCGAFQATLSSQDGVGASNSCQITVFESGQSLDLRVTASPVHLNGRRFTVLSIQDMADENRREILERTFFHDVLNAAGGASGIAHLLTEVDDLEEVQEFAPMLVTVTEQLVGEIHAQREMLAAERGDLAVDMEDCNSRELLHDVLHTYSRHPIAQGRGLEVEDDILDVSLHTSRTLLNRVLGNMVKNALEATEIGGVVRLGCDDADGECRFWVNNPAVMSRETQLQIFNRSFSTKGSGRGIGTYSIRLLGEKYLGGVVSFDSLEGLGTTFRIQIPPGVAEA